MARVDSKRVGFRVYSPLALVGNDTHNVETLAANKTMAAASPHFHHLDPGGASRDVTLPAEQDHKGFWYIIWNTADAAENLVVKNDGGSTIRSVGRGEVALFSCNGTAWVDMPLADSSAPGGALSVDTISELTSANGVSVDGVLLKDGVMTGGIVMDDGDSQLIKGNGTGTGDIVQRFGLTATEGYEIRVYEETISPAAVETNALNVPAGSVLLAVQTNVESALTAGGTSVTLSIGVTADPDKYGTHGSDSLAQNQKIDTIPAHAVLASSEQIALTAAATTGASAGDSAFSAGSVRVRIVYAALNSLDDA